jgi:hypothetical protein
MTDEEYRIALNALRAVAADAGFGDLSGVTRELVEEVLGETEPQRADGYRAEAPR